jgi:hypothetical protein
MSRVSMDVALLSFFPKWLRDEVRNTKYSVLISEPEPGQPGLDV